MERNQIIGFGLIFVLLVVWTFVNSPSKEQQAQMEHRQDSLNRLEILKIPWPGCNTKPKKIPSNWTQRPLANKYGSFATAVTGPAEKVRLENEFFIVDFDSKGGKISGVELKEYKKIIVDAEHKENKIPLRLLEDPANVWDFSLPSSRGDLHTADLNFQPVVNGNKVTFTATGSSGEQIIQEYELTKSPYEVKYNLKVETGSGSINASNPAKFSWINQLDKIERNSTFERSYSTVYFKENTESVDYCNCRKSAQESLPTQPIKWFAHSNQFFTSAIIADESFQGGLFSTTILDEKSDNLKTTSGVVGVPFKGNTMNAGMTMYIGPNDFDNLRQYGVNLEDVIPFGRSVFGTINRWIIRPLFDFLLTFIGSQGIAILVLTLLVKLALFPLSYKMLQSQVKMSVLKPQLAGMKDKYKDDMQKQQMETMKVYREYGVNPLGGCFPVVLQMPVWFALYRFFPASIQFRQAPFLWATDLSSYDVFINLPTAIPMFGSHISLLTFLWAGSTIAYTYYNMQNMDMSNMNPALKYMQYLMPVMFLVFFNSYASGLTLYLLYSNLLNIAQTVGAKRLLFDEDKVLETLNQNKAKPKKEGGFQARLEQAMKEQQKQADLRKNPPSTGGGKKKN
jgi:YidC/Oxa1 family membrane protein insertase